jgi:hypothetical protein
VASTRSDGVSCGASMVVVLLWWQEDKRKIWYGRTYAGRLTIPGYSIHQCSRNDEAN